MSKGSIYRNLGQGLETGSPSLKLEDGNQVAVMGGGPAGSLFAYFLLEMAQRVGLNLEVDIYEPRDFNLPGPPGCNMCAGIVSESVIQMLAVEGITLPPTVVQRGMDTYILHTNEGKARLETPGLEKRIGAVFRGAGPFGVKDSEWGSFDGFLLEGAIPKGANLIRWRSEEVAQSAADKLNELAALALRGEKTLGDIAGDSFWCAPLRPARSEAFQDAAFTVWKGEPPRP